VNQLSRPQQRRSWARLRVGINLGRRVLEHKIVSSVIATVIAAAIITWLGLK
jgi:hypothetical protein